MALLRSLRSTVLSRILSPPPSSKLPLLLREPPIAGPAFAAPASRRHFSAPAFTCMFPRLTDTRFPKRRPSASSRNKRASLRPKGPYAWVHYTHGQPIQPSQPNEGSIKRRKEKKRIMQRKAFILAEKKKRQAQYTEHLKKKEEERIERKMAAVARDKAWAERLIELQQIEEAKKASRML